MAWRVSHYVAASAVVAGGMYWAASAVWAARRLPVARAIVVTDAYEHFGDSLGRREILADVLARAGIAGRDYGNLLVAATALEPRRLRQGQRFEFRRVKHARVADRVMIRPSPERRIWLTRRGGDTGWVQTEEVIPWVATRSRIEGGIETSLYDALDQAVAETLLPANERRELAWAIADVYDWEVDFTRDIRPGDRFTVLFERLESPEGERRFARILAARVDVAKTPSFAFYFEGDSARGAFYDERGRSLRRAFLRNPLEFRRISSRFGGRFHPVLKTWRNHQGIDYSASAGTPVRATADGVVTQAGREGGYGNLVELRHANGIRTRYGHLSRFGARLRVGARVKQQQTIGYVGSTGLSTGPHLHYEFLVNGRATNPQRKSVGEGTPVPARYKTRYEQVRAALLAELLPPAPPGSPSVSARDD